MNKVFFSLIICFLVFQALSVVPEWDLSKAGEDLLGTNSEITIEVNHRRFLSVDMIMKKKLTKENGSIKIKNLLNIAGTEKEVPFDQVESYYNLFSTYIVCPKGKYHPYNFNTKEEVIPKDFVGENWDLRCYKHNIFFLVFYLMNGDNANIYLTNMKKIDWYNGASIDKEKIRETYDFLLQEDKDKYGNYQMMSILNKDNNIKLAYLAYKLEEGEGKQYVDYQRDIQIIEKGSYTQAYFKNSTDNDKYFYYFTYNDITDFKSGYSTSSIGVKSDYYYVFDDFKFQNNDYPHFEFFDNMKIEKMEFLLYNKFIYYEMVSLNNSDVHYYGIFDVKLNKIIFNTKEEITDFIPYNEMTMLAVTKDKAYKICAYKDNNNCVDTCSNNYLLDIEGNTCGTTECPSGKLSFMPLGVCINEDKCDENYYVIDNNKCGLCKDINSSYPFKLIGGTDCLKGIIEGSYLSNSNLKLLNCSTGYHLEKNKCVSDKQCYELCKDCSESSTSETDQKCTSCIDGFNLDDKNNCVCPSGKEKSDKNCKNCTNTCDKYILNKCDCESCPDGYFLNNLRCDKCDLSCSKCEGESTNCTECKEWEFLENNKCYNCTSCKESIQGSCKCKSCLDGYYLENYQCKECQNDCVTCSSASKCLSCGQFYFLENAQCKTCSDDLKSKCNSTEKNTCKCTSCKQNYFLYNNECNECVKEEQCETYEDDKKCKCKKCNKGFYYNNFSCKECEKNCETCDGGYFNDLNYHCLSCNNNTENKYLINTDDKHICVSDCSKYNGTNNTEKNICEFESNDDGEDGVVYMLWIFVALIGIILIIISICICKKFICQKNDEIGNIDEMEAGELMEK